MSESIQFTPATEMVSSQSKRSALAGDKNSAISANGESPSGFTALLNGYLKAETVAAEQQLDQDMTKLLAAILPQEGFEQGKLLPQDDNMAMWQALALLPAIEKSASNNVGTYQTEGFNLLDAKRNSVSNNPMLEKNYLHSLIAKMAQSEQSFNDGSAVKNISNQLAAVHFNPNTSETLLLNLNDQLIPVHGTGSNLANGLSAVGLGSATIAANTQTQMAPLNLGQNAWESNLGSRLQMLIGQNVQTATIRLDPPELGMLDVKIKISNDVATVNFTSPNAQVRDAIETAMPRLREMFAETGLSLGDVNVRQESFSQQQNHAEENKSTAFVTNNIQDENEQAQITRKIVSNNLLDIYA